MSKGKPTENHSRRLLKPASDQTNTKTAPTSISGAERGLVVTNFGPTLIVEDSQDDLHPCVPRKNIATPVCGDHVLWLQETAGLGAVIAIEDRKNLLERPDARGRMKPIAANIDQITVVLAAQPGNADLDFDLLDCYLIAAETSRINALIVINKIDLLNEHEIERLSRHLEDYRRIAYPVLMISVKQHCCLEEILQIFKNNTSVIVGPSGAGKSSLIKALAPDIDIRIGAISEATGLGKHTTTVATLYHLPQSGNLIDSPGVREFGLWHIEPGDIRSGFREFRAVAASCKFRDCTHIREPGCAVRVGVDEGKISRLRYESYLRRMESLSEVKKF